MIITHVTTSFEMQDGRELTCSYAIARFPGTYDDPPESEAGEPDYHISGEEIDYNSLPKGLKAIADKLYSCGLGQFNYRETD